jgi:iron-sulfur cluster assembly accessory protein
MENKLKITENAQKHIASILNSNQSKYFRITVLGGGCAGFQYKFDFDKKINNDDILVKTKNVTVLIDNTSFELIKDSKIDYVTELIGSSFKISNPHASSSCGCGTSFSI